MDFCAWVSEVPLGQQRKGGFCPSAPLRGDPAQEGPGAAGESPEEAIELLGELEHLPCGTRLRELRLLSLQRRRLCGDLTAPSRVCRNYKKI